MKVWWREVQRGGDSVCCRWSEMEGAVHKDPREASGAKAGVGVFLAGSWQRHENFHSANT